MPHPGAVVSRAGRHAVVWRVLSDGYALVPIYAGEPITRADVAITGLADRIACCCFGPSYIRAGHVTSVRWDGQDHTGDVTPELLAAVNAAVARAAADRADARKWESDRRYRRVALEVAR